VKRPFKNVLVTGGAGFIGSAFVEYLAGRDDFRGRVVVFDALTYAGNPASLAPAAEKLGKERYAFVRADIRDRDAVGEAFAKFDIDAVVHLAAESHVDRSIIGPRVFLETNVIGTFNLLDAAVAAWKGRDDTLFHHVSTDEVFGSLGETGKFDEGTAYDPRSPYSASKASSDHLVSAYHHTYGLPTTVTNCSNNYGPRQFPEKLVPLMILNMMEGRPLPVYGDGKNVRDWLYVEDHAAAIWLVMNEAAPGSTWTVGGENEWENLRLLRELISIVADETGRGISELERLITYVADRPGHDRRYAIDCRKIRNELGWRRSVEFSEGLRATVRWYLSNPGWVEGVKSGAYREWIDANYGGRGG
jgi:dTDP-glucose 4,6-dehydratase